MEGIKSQRWKLVRDVTSVPGFDQLDLEPMEIFLPEANTLLIGSAEGSLCDIRFNSRFVSKSHSQIVCINKTWYLQDSGSANGTFCNGIRVTDVQDLREHDKIGFGVPGFEGCPEELYSQCYIFELVQESEMSPVDELNVDSDELEGCFDGNPDITYQLPRNLRNKPKQAYKCKHCPSCFDRPETYITHIRRHGVKPPHPFRCDFCNYSCFSRMGQTKHLQKHQIEKQDSFKASPKSAAKSSPGRLDSSGSVRPKKRLLCAHCPASFEAYKDRNKHLQRHGSDSGPFKCHMCNFGTKRNFHLARHMLVHNITGASAGPGTSSPGHYTDTPPEKRLKCEKCPATFPIVRDYRSHMARHGAQSSHPCTICDFAAGRSDYLHKHLLLHKEAESVRSPTKVEAFKCPHCPAVFKQKVTLNQHISCHDSGQPFQCRFCSYAANLGWARRKHELVHIAVTKKKPKLTSTGSLHPKSSGLLRNLLTSKHSDPGIRKKYVRSANLLSAEEFRKLKTGNPKFVYRDIYKSVAAGILKIKTTYKCDRCPSAFPGLPALLKHASLHGADLKHKCGVCDYSAVNSVVMLRHAEVHESQPQLNEFNSVSRKHIATKSTSHIPRRMAHYGSPHFTKLEPGKETHVKQLRFDSPAKPPICVSSDMYPIKDITSNIHEKPAKQLITSVKVTNFMCFPELELKFKTHTQAFYGESEKGKSASILAMLLGIGYDIGLPNYTPESLCGWELRKEVVRRGSETSLIELVISLNSCPELEEQYGNHLKLERLIYKGVPLASSKFVISSADTLKRHPSIAKPIALSGLRSVLTKLNMLPVYFPLMHLDRQNMQQLLDNPGSWYDFYEQNIKSQQQTIHEKLKDLYLVSKRINDDLHWRNLRLNFHLNQLKADYPVDDSPFQEWRKIDIVRHSETKKDLEDIRQKQFALEKVITSYNDELLDVPALILRQMQSTYCKFLHSSKLGGGVLIDDSRKRIGLWVREMTFCGDEKPPSTVEEAEAAWEDLSRQKKHMAIIGLFLAFWKCIDDCPFFSVDAYSSSELEFRFPKNGLPLLLDLIGSKRRTGQQFIISLPSDD